jgi:hypothetical protein
LLAVRRASDALRVGRYRALPSPGGTYVFAREAENERLYVALNFTPRERGVSLPERTELLLSTDDQRSVWPVGAGVVLGPDEGVIARVSARR